MEEINIKVGVLIIGSLWWEGDAQNDSMLRFAWRREFLCDNYEQTAVSVHLPIRYGRYSEKDNIYTMVFSSSCDEKPGKGYAVRLRAESITSYEELKKQALAMAKVEGMKKGFIGGGPKTGAWATMVILFNPKHNNSPLKEKLLEWWKRKIIESGEQPNKSPVTNNLESYKLNTDTRSALTSYGEIQIHWPSSVISSKQPDIDQFDVLIAACTKPNSRNSGEYPDPQEVATLARKDQKRHYFLNNIENNIATFQDQAIKEQL